MKKISIAIPTYFSSKYLKILLKSIKNLKNINEIVIGDDSGEKDEVKNLIEVIKDFDKSLNIKFYKNNKNIGAFDNKYLTLSRCSNEIVYQIDSDNIVSKSFDNTLNDILDTFDDSKIYYPSSLKQFFNNYQYYIFPNKNLVNLSIGDKEITGNDVSSSIKNNTKITVDKNIYWILNCGNFLVLKDQYLKTMDQYYQNKKIPLAADALAISFLWLNSGKSLLLKEDFYHFHRKRSDSVSLSLEEESKE